MTPKIQNAIDFAIDKHMHQQRKYTGEPYFNHCASVAQIVGNYTDDEDMICAAFLHDTVEDTDTSFDELLGEFGPIITQYVRNLTDVSRPEDGNRAARKKIDREHIWQGCRNSQIIKLADVIDNSMSILRHDLGFAKVYIPEMQMLLSGMTVSVKETALFSLAAHYCDYGIEKRLTA